MRYKLRAWIDYLAYRAAGHEGTLRLAGVDGGEPQRLTAELTAEAAREDLAALLRLYQEGLCTPLLFLPDLAEIYLEWVVDKEKPAETALHRLNGQLGADRHARYEANDVYFAPLLGDPPLGAEPGDTRFCELAEAICGPPFEAMKPA